MIFVLLGVLMWVWENVPHWLIGLGLAAWLASDIASFHKRHFWPHDAYKQQLTMGSHGAAFIVLAPLITTWAQRNGWTYYLSDELQPWLWPGTFAFMGFGAYCLIFGYFRTPRYRMDAQLISRALAKIAVGGTVFVLTSNQTIRIIDWPQPYRSLGAQIIFCFCIWCVVTGLAKLVLLVRPFPWEWEDENGVNGFQKWKSTFFVGWHIR